jgi:hypothetical protein
LPFSNCAYDKETLSMVHGVLDTAWSEFEQAGHTSNVHPLALRIVMAERMMAEIKAGNRDPAQLKFVALEAAIGHQGPAT